MTGPDLLAGALRLAAAGTPVFPCAPSKAPRTPHGVKDASRDPAQIADWWRRWPDSLIGVPTGAPTGTAAIDIDVKDGARGLEWLEAHRDRIPRTRRHRTRSGGAHLIVRVPEGIRIRNSASRIAPGVDVRGDGGFVIHPPSPGYLVEDEAPPADPPDWLLELLVEQPKPAPAMLPPVHARPADMEGTRYGLAALDAECAGILNAPDGAKHDTLNRGAYSIAGLVAAGELAEAPALAALRSALAGIRSRCADFAAAERTLADAWAAGLARPRAAPPPLPAPARREVVPPEPPPHAEPAEDCVAGSEDAPAAPSRGRLFGRLRVLSVADALVAAARLYLLLGLIARGELSVWWGAPKSGKSFLVLRLAFGLALGRGMWGRKAKPARVLYVAAEGEGGFAARLLALRDELGDPGDAFQYIAQRATVGPPSDDLAPIIEAARAMAADIVVLDTLARTFGAGNENEARDMGGFIEAADRIREATGAHVAVIHHGSKDPNATTPRGSIALVAAADLVVKIAKGTDGAPNTATIEACKDDEDGAVMPFALRVVDMGTDDEGNPRTTCIAEEADPPAGAHKKKALPAGAGPVLDAIHSLFAEGHGRAAQPFPNGPTVQAIALPILRHRLIRQAWFEEHHFRQELAGALPDRRVLNDAGYKAEGKAIKALAEARIIGRARPDGRKGEVLIWLNS